MIDRTEWQYNFYSLVAYTFIHSLWFVFIVSPENRFSMFVRMESWMETADVEAFDKHFVTFSAGKSYTNNVQCDFDETEEEGEEKNCF